MNYWLFKTESSEYSIDDLKNEPHQTVRWDGIRNYQARNFIRDQIKKGDNVLIYHSQTRHVGIVGSATVSSDSYPDPNQFNEDSKYFDENSQKSTPKWYAVDICFKEKFAAPLLLKTIKATPELAQMVLLKQGRLSIQPVTEQEWQRIHELRK